MPIRNMNATGQVLIQHTCCLLGIYLLNLCFSTHAKEAFRLAERSKVNKITSGGWSGYPSCHEPSSVEHLVYEAPPSEISPLLPQCGEQRAFYSAGLEIHLQR